MASYSSYRKVDGAQIDAATIPSSKIAFTALNSWNVVWFFGAPQAASGGCCCLWTVPANVRRLFIEAWGAGGNGHGACS